MSIRSTIPLDDHQTLMLGSGNPTPYDACALAALCVLAAVLFLVWSWRLGRF